SPQASVTFRHLGSLFCLTLKNASGSALENLGRAELISSVSGWAYNNSATEQCFYDLVEDAFQESGTAGSFITLYGDGGDGGVATNETLSFWGWYPPLPEGNWPDLTLELYDKNNILIGESGNVKWGRTSQPGNCYHLYAVKNDVGAGLHFTDHTYAGVFDADGNYYSTVIIGDQEWFAGNLKTTRYNDGTAIPNVTDNAAWASLTTDAYVWYANDEATYKNAYGALYNGYAVNTGNLCPAGWHVPSDAEWTTLINYAGGADVSGGKLKSKRTEPDDHPRWGSPNTGATDAYGFSALPGGRRYADYGYFGNVGFSGQWWSSTEAGATYAWVRNVSYANGSVSRNYYNKRDGFSVRCLRDN
ncbi:MAG: endo 2, partial [Proteiniphilum sp.]|nr:endo 2 [Proteiniphilum sp.]